MTLTILDVDQGTPEWHDARRGMITASTIGQLITPRTVQVANNETSRSLTHLLAAERISGNTDPTYASYDMQRGTFDEPVARQVYHDNIAPVTECGFMILTTDEGYRIGYSPDGLVDEDGCVEIKSRRQKEHLTHVLANKVPSENMAQIQCGLYVSGRAWCDYVSYCSGMALWTKRVYPDPKWQTAILDAVTAFETRAAELITDYVRAVAGLPVTVRVPELEEMRIA